MGEFSLCTYGFLALRNTCKAESNTCFPQYFSPFRILVFGPHVLHLFSDRLEGRCSGRPRRRRTQWLIYHAGLVLSAVQPSLGWRLPQRALQRALPRAARRWRVVPSLCAAGSRRITVGSFHCPGLRSLWAARPLVQQAAHP